MPAAAAASASAEEAEDDPVLALLSRKPLGSLKWVVVEESEEEPPPDHQQHQQPHQQQHQQYDRAGVAVARRPSTPRGPEGGLWSAATTPPRPRSPATTPPTASNGGGGGGGGSNGGSHNSSRRVYYLDVDKPARLVNDAIHQRALMTAGMAAGLGASPLGVLSGGARSAASSSFPLASDRGVDFAGGQGLGGGGGGRRGGVWWRSWPALILLVLVGAAAGALFGLRSRVGMHMALMLLVGAAAVVAGLLVWACCRHAEAEEEGFDDEGQGEEGLGFVEGAAGQPGRNDRRRHYGSTLAGP
jgi:hypothetical protein